MSEKSKPFKNSRPKVFIKTFGCQMNVHDSEKIAGIFAESGYDRADEAGDADVVVLNTCSIRQKAEHKVFSDLGRLKTAKAKNPNLKVAVAGCIAQQKGSSLFKRFPIVDFVLGPGNIDSLGKWLNGNAITKDEGRPRKVLKELEQRGRWTRDVKSNFRPQTPPADSERILTRGQATALSDNPDYHTKTLPIHREGRVKAWVSIMYGCDNFCAYCVVPYTRGRERSRQSSDIHNEVSGLADQGYKEITLLGQNVNSYGKNLDGNINFPDLLKVIHEIPGIDRIRFVTSHPKDLSERLIDAVSSLPKLCEHIHLPLQAGSDNILRLMNRKYTYQDFKEKIELLRKKIPGVAITSDIITGFPGESDKDFNCTITALSEMEFDGIFAFKYSKRPDTKALDHTGHVDEKIKSRRLSEVLDIQSSITYKKNKKLEGEVLEVLVEGLSDSGGDKLTGRTRTNKIVFFQGRPQDIGHIVGVKIIEAKQHSLTGELIADDH